LLLDEPLSNLDANLREEMRFEIKQLQRTTGATILYVTHDQEVALAISDRMAVMDTAGSFRQVGTPTEIFESPVDAFVFRSLGVANFIPVETSGGTARLRSGTPFPGFPSAKAASGSRFLAACRPMDLVLRRDGGDLSGKIVRKALLGSMIDYRIDLGGTIVRCQLQTEEAIARDLVLDEGAACGLGLSNLVWYPDAGESVEANA
jgi:iron(III) transport system ATP-binding protein